MTDIDKEFELVKDAIKELVKEYGYEEHEEVILKIARRDIVKEIIARSDEDFSDDPLYRETLELARLIFFLRKNRGFEIKMSCKESGTDKISLSSLKVHDYLEMWAHTLLERLQDGSYQNLFNWDYKQRMKWIRQIDGEEIEEEDPFYTDPYTDEELDLILRYEEGQVKRHGALYDLSHSAQRGKRLKRLNDDLNKERVFQAKMHKEEKGEALGITQEYTFLYDYLVCVGVLRESDTYDNADKRIVIRDWIDSYERVLANFKKKFGKEKK